MPDDTVKELQAIYDCTIGKRKHFIVGTVDSQISGGLYLKEGVELPERILLTFIKGK